MRRFVRDRLFVTVLIAWATVTLTFFALHVLPGDAVSNQLAQGGASEAEIAARRAALGLDSPLFTQYITYLTGVVQGDLGYSYINQQPVARLIGGQFGATVSLALTALAIAMTLGFTLGSIDALTWPRWPAKIAGTVSILALSTPIYWTGTLAIYVFSSYLGLLPAIGSGDIRHLILPATVLGASLSGSIARVTRTSLRSTLDADFIRTALAKGLPRRRVFTHHVLKAGLPPIVSMIALQVGFLLGGTVITEMLFVRRGLGQLLHNAVLDQDYPVVQGIVILSAVTYSLMGAAADLLHGLLDPRIRVGSEE